MHTTPVSTRACSFLPSDLWFLLWYLVSSVFDAGRLWEAESGSQLSPYDAAELCSGRLK